MKVKTIAAAIVEAGPEKFGMENYQAALAALAAGGATEVEASPSAQILPLPYEEGEQLDLPLLGLVQVDGIWTNPE